MLRTVGCCAVAIAWVAYAIGCIKDDLVPCGTQLCPAGASCVAGELCASPEQLQACSGIADGDPCTLGTTVSTCDRGVCVVGSCGNGVVESTEACDDGNATSGDGCRADCAKVEVCGDAILDSGEGCDDGNANAADQCDACRPTRWVATAVLGASAMATNFGLARPDDVAVDYFGNLYITDTNRHRLLRVDDASVVTVIAGTGAPGFSGDGGKATSALLDYPVGLATDGLGNVYFIDSYNHRVRRIDAAGVITTIAGNGIMGSTGDGGAATAAAVDPSAIAVDGLGNVFLCEPGANRVRRIDGAGIITPFAGTGMKGTTGDNGPATNAELDAPIGIAIDPRGLAISTAAGIRIVDGDGIITMLSPGAPNHDLASDGAGTLYVIGTYAVHAVASDGTVTVAAGTGTRGFSGDGGPATAANLSFVTGITVDPSGRLVIADQDNFRIRRVEAGVITTIVGNGNEGASGDGGAGTSAGLVTPVRVAVDAQGTVFVADMDNHRIRRISTDGVITTIAGIGTGGYSGDGGPATSAELYYPQGLAVDAQGNVFIADTDNNVIRRVDTNGIITTLAGTGESDFTGDGGPATAATLSSPYAVATDPNGNLYIADASNHAIRRIAPDGIITTIAGTGVEGTSGDNGPATSALLDLPVGVTYSGGEVYIVEFRGRSVRKIDVNGVMRRVAGSGASGAGGDNGPATSAQLGEPFSVAVSGGDVYIADSDNSRIRKVTGGTITTFVGSTNGDDGDGGPAAAAKLLYPYGVAVDGQGRLVIADTYNYRIRRVDVDGTITAIGGRIDADGMGPFDHARLNDPRAIVIAPAFTLFAGGVAGTVQAIRAGTSWLGTVIGRYDALGPTGQLARFRSRSFGSVGGVAYDAALNAIIIAETSANRLHLVTLVDPADENTWTIAPLANSSGLAGFADGPVAGARFREPTALYLDEPMHRLYVADTGNHVIRMIDLSSGVASATVSTFAGVPQTRGLVGDGGAAAEALLFEPQAITRCANGDYFIADTGNNRIRRIEASSGTITTVLGVGVAASSGEGAPASTFPVDTPLGLACDTGGNLFVTSSRTVRMLVADDAGIVDGTGTVQSIYGAQPRDSFPANASSCLSGIAIVDSTTVRVADACAGLLVELKRELVP